MATPDDVDRRPFGDGLTAHSIWQRERGRTGDYAPVTNPETPIEIQAALQDLRAAVHGKTWSTFSQRVEEQVYDRQI